MLNLKMIKRSDCQEEFVYSEKISNSSTPCTGRLETVVGGEPSEDLYEQIQNARESSDCGTTEVEERQESETLLRSAQVFVKSVILKKPEDHELHDVGIQACPETAFDEELSSSPRSDNIGDDKLEDGSQNDQENVTAKREPKQTNLSYTDGSTCTSEDENDFTYHNAIDLAKQEGGQWAFVKKVIEDAKEREVGDNTGGQPQAKKEEIPKSRRTRSQRELSSDGKGLIINKIQPPIEPYKPEVSVMYHLQNFLFTSCRANAISKPWLPCLLLLCFFSASSGTNINWTIASKPAVIGENLTLACAVGSPVYPVSWHRGKSEELLDLVSMETYPSDRQKFEITVGKVENMTWYNLTIMDLNTSDLGLYYRCSNGDNMWDVRMLNFSEYNLLSIPGENDVVNGTRMDKKVKKVSLIIDRVYPKPACHLSSEQARPQTLKDNVLREDYGRYQLEYRFDIPPCSRQTLSCDLANQTIVNKTFLGFDAPECFPLDPDDGYPPTVPGDGVPILTVLIVFAILFLVICICYLVICRDKNGATERVRQQENEAVQLVQRKGDELTNGWENADPNRELGKTLPIDQELSTVHCMEWIGEEQPLKCCFNIKLGRTTVVTDPADD